ncbi:MAG: SPOR domain-containing protein [Bacteroidia bacterium]|nr:SPOR domain-containing protein [Bacteroidia bacterium]
MILLNWITLLLVLFSDSTRSNYTRYETQNIQPFRKVFAFKSPVEASTFVQQYKITSSFKTEEKKIQSKVEGNFEINRLLRLHIENNAKIRLVNGFRIQIYSGSNQKESAQVRLEFLEKFPGVPVYNLYERPYFKVRAGEFVSRLEVEAFLKSVKQYFPGSFIVPDKVELIKGN